MAPSYKAGVTKSDGAEAFHKKTTARLEQIRSQFTTTPRGGKLENKVCIITGVGSLKGIGRATALLYAHEGARHLYLLDFDPTNLPDLKSTIETKYPDVKVTTLAADAADEAAIAGLCKQALEEEGRLDVFFANAGIATNSPLAETTTETFTRTMRINALSCFIAVKYGAEAMAKTNSSRGKEFGSGSIILTASIAGIRSGAGSVDYSASKAAVNSIANTTAYQLARTDIRVNAICPGLIETGMTSDFFDYARDRGSEAKIGQLNPLARYAIPQEIAHVALFLASDAASYINGQNIAVDGGMTASVPIVPGRFS